MNVASLENCKKLYELSGWFPKSLQYAYYELDGREQLLSAIRVSDSEPRFGSLALLAPAYDLGYLLRKLPGLLDLELGTYGVRIRKSTIGDGWSAEYDHSRRAGESYMLDILFTQKADTPEDAACLLAIKLFEAGILVE